VRDFRLRHEVDGTVLLCVVTNHAVVTFCRRFGITYRSHLQGSRTCFLIPEDEIDRLSRNVGKNYLYSQLNNPGERSSERFGVYMGRPKPYVLYKVYRYIKWPCFVAICHVAWCRFTDLWTLYCLHVQGVFSETSVYFYLSASARKTLTL